MGIQRSPLQRKCDCGESSECAECTEGRMLQRKAANRLASGIAPPIVHEVLNSPGKPLEQATRNFFEARLRHDFSQVRVHTGMQAAASARSINALAYTVGGHIVFGDGQYAPKSQTGRSLIAHELAHILQQGAPTKALPARLPGSTARDHWEREEDRQAGGIATPARVSRTLGLWLQRQPSPGPSCSVEICFKAIGRFGLGLAGLKHAIINVDEGSGIKHVEVDPDFHQPQGMLHSHVVNAAGHKDGDTCQTLPATCKEASAVIAAANEYESKDIIYDPITRTGPNSNSFAEWTLARAGLKTAAVTVPLGAQGWDYFMTNPAERTDPPHVLRGMPTAAGASVKTSGGAACPKVFQKANNPAEFVNLVREAETRMTAAGISSNPDKIKTLRGLYYGTPWSVDFAEEKSPSRIAGFQAFTASGTKLPRDPVSLLDCGLYQALQLSQDITAKAGKVDIGHLMIALDARNANVLSVQTPNLPFPGFGGSGVEIVTWLGDLGGGAGSLALDRAREPGKPLKADVKFKGNDYGAPSNLEGDVAGFVAARASGASGGGADVPSITAGKGVADALSDYFAASPAASTTAWDQRARTFLSIYGGTFDASGNLTNAASLVTTFAGKIESFACAYLTQRKADSASKISDQEFLDAADNIRPCSQEVAETFVNILETTSKSPSRPMEATGMAPAQRPAASGACAISTTALRLKMRAQQVRKLLPSPFGGD
jgi:hypothetical protein